MGFKVILIRKFPFLKMAIQAIHIEIKKGIKSLVKSGSNSHIGLLNSCGKGTTIFRIASIYAKINFKIYKWWICEGEDIYLKRGTVLCKSKINKTKGDCQKTDKSFDCMSTTDRLNAQSIFQSPCLGG